MNGGVVARGVYRVSCNFSRRRVQLDIFRYIYTFQCIFELSSMNSLTECFQRGTEEEIVWWVA